MISKNDSPVFPEDEAGEPLSPLARIARLVLEIAPGERRLLPEFGCRVHRMPSLAEPESRELAGALVEEALDRWAPGLGVDRAEVGLDGEGAMAVRLRARGSWHELRVSHRFSAGRGAAEEEPR